MTTADYPDSPTAAALGGDVDTSSTTGTQSTGAKEQAKQTAGTAADESKHVAGVAQGEAQKVASEAKSQVHSLVGQATSQVEDQSRTQRDRLVGTLRSFGDDLEKMASQGDDGPATGLARDAADRVRSLSTHLDGREPRELLDDVRDYARRKPGTFLLGALAAGVVAGRLTRGAKDAQSSSSSGGSQSGVPAYGAAPTIPAPRGYAESDPAYPTGTGLTDTELSGTGLPNPAGSVASGTGWSDTGTRGDLS